MKIFTFLLFVISLIPFNNLTAQNQTTVKAVSDDISNNLDLEVVAALFGESENLMDFEQKLNDPFARISNLDLNEDDEVDYLRVIDNSFGNEHIITIQAVIGFDLYQDVATIDVVKTNTGTSQVQVTGNNYVFGSDFIISVMYEILPSIFDYLWNSIFYTWESPYSYNNYPSCYCACTPTTTIVYNTNIYNYGNVNNYYHYTSVSIRTTPNEKLEKYRRNDIEILNPDNSFVSRNNGLKNKHLLNTKEKPTVIRVSSSKEIIAITGKKVLKDWKPNYVKEERESMVNNNTLTVNTTAKKEKKSGGLNKTISYSKPAKKKKSSNYKPSRSTSSRNESSTSNRSYSKPNYSNNNSSTRRTSSSNSANKPNNSYKSSKSRSSKASSNTKSSSTRSSKNSSSSNSKSSSNKSSTNSSKSTSNKSKSSSSYKPSSKSSSKKSSSSGSSSSRSSSSSYKPSSKSKK